MSKLRPECESAIRPSKFLQEGKVDRKSALYAIYKAVARRRSLAYGVLDNDETGKHCAMGCFWADNKGEPVPTMIVDEVAAVNDSVPADATPKQRWDVMMNWLRTQLSRES